MEKAMEKEDFNWHVTSVTKTIKVERISQFDLIQELNTMAAKQREK